MCQSPSLGRVSCRRKGLHVARGVLVTEDLITPLLPFVLGARDVGFNVFDVMRHGTHEKQLSNVFAWLLDIDGTHRLGDRFQRIFVDEVNRGLKDGDPVGYGPYAVRQEVNTAATRLGGDFADLVLESEYAVLVVENYATSDGHGHSYDRYVEFGCRGARCGVGVLLCRDVDPSAQTQGWEHAPVVTYGALVNRLRDAVAGDRRYQRTNPEAFSFIDQLHRKYGEGNTRMEDSEALHFVTAMCATGASVRYGEKGLEQAAARFAEDVSKQGHERFVEGHELLQRVKWKLKAFCDQQLRMQLNETYGDGFVSQIGAKYSGIYQWTVNLVIPETGGNTEEAPLQVEFGPSARYANVDDPGWGRTAGRGEAEYSHLFLTRAVTREVRQSAVTLQQVLDGISYNDRTLHDEVVDLLRPEHSPTRHDGALP